MSTETYLASRYASEHPREAAHLLENLAEESTVALLGDLQTEQAGAILEHMQPARAARVWMAMERSQLPPMLGYLTPSHMALILRQIPQGQRDAFQKLLPASTASHVQRLLKSPEGSAAALAKPVTAVLRPEMTVLDARQAFLGSVDPYAYVVDQEHRLVGVLHRRDLAQAQGEARVVQLMSRDVIRLPAAAPLSALSSHPAWTELDTLPVTDTAGTLMGLIRHKDVRRKAFAHTFRVPRGQPALSGFLQLGELYWESLESLIAALAGGTVTHARGARAHDH